MSINSSTHATHMDFETAMRERPASNLRLRSSPREYAPRRRVVGADPN